LNWQSENFAFVVDIHHRRKMKNILTNSHKTSLCLCLLMLVLLALGCNFFGRLAKFKANYFESDAAQVAAEAIREKIGKPFKVFEIEITPGEFTLQAQDSNNPRNLDLYKYAAGFVVGPTPVQINAVQHGNLEQTTFPFDEINFAALPQIVQESLSKAGLEGGRVTKMTFDRGFAMSEKGVGNLGNARWLIEIEGTRESATARADPQGKLLGVDLSRTSQAADYNVFKNGELQKAQDTLINSLGEDAKIEKIAIYDKYVLVEAPNPQNPREMDSHKFDISGLTKSGLMTTSSKIGSYQENFSLGEVNLPEALNFVEKAKNRLDMPSGNISHITIKREKSPMEKNKAFRTIWSLSLKDGVNDGSVDYDNNGEEISISKR
jgi:hypothetical protein